MSPGPEPPPDDAPTTLRTRIVDDQNLQAALHRVAAAGCQLLSNRAAASITIIERGRALSQRRPRGTRRRPRRQTRRLSTVSVPTATLLVGGLWDDAVRV
jgi:hypothetical protein